MVWCLCLCASGHVFPYLPTSYYVDLKPMNNMSHVDTSAHMQLSVYVLNNHHLIADCEHLFDV